MLSNVLPLLFCHAEHNLQCCLFYMFDVSGDVLKVVLSV